MKREKYVLVSMALLAVSVSCPAGWTPVHALTIVAVEGPFLGVSTFLNEQVVATEWSTTTGYTDVSIAASIGSLNPSFRTGIAFLTSRIGPGTTVNDLIATQPFTAPVVPSYDTPVSNTTIFTNLTLAPSTYYLVLTAPSGAGGSPYWNAYGVVSTTTAPGVTTIPGVFFAINSNIDPTFPPASTLQLSPFDQQFFQVVSAPIPEPATWLLLATGLVGLLSYRRRRKK